MQVWQSSAGSRGHELRDDSAKSSVEEREQEERGAVGDEPGFVGAAGRVPQSHVGRRYQSPGRSVLWGAPTATGNRGGGRESTLGANHAAADERSDRTGARHHVASTTRAEGRRQSSVKAGRRAGPAARYATGGT